VVVVAAAALGRPAAATVTAIVARLALLLLLVLGMLLLLLHRGRIWQGTEDAERLERDLGGVLLGVVVIVASVPVACLEVLAVDGHDAGVGCTAAWRVGGK